MASRITPGHKRGPSKHTMLRGSRYEELAELIWEGHDRGEICRIMNISRHAVYRALKTYVMTEKGTPLVSEIVANRIRLHTMIRLLDDLGFNSAQIAKYLDISRSTVSAHRTLKTKIIPPHFSELDMITIEIVSDALFDSQNRRIPRGTYRIRRHGMTYRIMFEDGSAAIIYRYALGGHAELVRHSPFRSIGRRHRNKRDHDIPKQPSE